MKKPHQSREQIRGSDKSSLSQSGFNGKIPTAAFIAFERELFGIEHGLVNLSFHIRDGKLYRFTTSREQSIFNRDQSHE